MRASGAATRPAMPRALFLEEFGTLHPTGHPPQQARPKVSDLYWPYMISTYYILLCVREKDVSVCAPAGNVTMWMLCLLPAERIEWMIKLPPFKNPVRIVNKIAGYDIWRRILAWYEFQQIKRTNESAICWSRCLSRLQMHASGIVL